MERSSEISSINGGMARRLGVVQIFAFGTVQLDSAGIGNVGLTSGEKGLSLAHQAGTFTEVALFVLLGLCASTEVSLVSNIKQIFSRNIPS